MVPPDHSQHEDPLVLKARIAKALRHGKTLLRLYDGLARAQARLNEGRSQ